MTYMDMNMDMLSASTTLGNGANGCQWLPMEARIFQAGAGGPKPSSRGGDRCCPVVSRVATVTPASVCVSLKPLATVRYPIPEHRYELANAH